MDAEFLAEYVHGRHTTDDYVERFMRDRLFEAALAGCPTDLRRRCSSALRLAFARFDALPRTDPLWTGSNNRVTFTKLRDQMKLARIDDRDLESCWAVLVIALCSGDLERFEQASVVLLRTSELRLSEFLRASFNLCVVSGWETDSLTVQILANLEMGAVARAELDGITKQASADLVLWAEKVGRLIGRAG